MNRNGVRAEAEPRLLLYETLSLAILARWIAMAVFIIVGGKYWKTGANSDKRTWLQLEGKTQT